MMHAVLHAGTHAPHAPHASHTALHAGAHAPGQVAGLHGPVLIMESPSVCREFPRPLALEGQLAGVGHSLGKLAANDVAFLVVEDGIDTVVEGIEPVRGLDGFA